VWPGAGRSAQATTYQTCPVALALSPWVERVADLEAAMDAGAVHPLSAVGWHAVRWWRTLRGEPTAAEDRAARERGR
jgi:hypothetical protein